MPDWFMDLGRGLIDSGADLIVGHGVPVLQRIVFHRNRPIFGSLGNFIFHTERASTYDREGVDVWSGALCKCRFTDSGCDSIDIMPITVGRPEAGAAGLPPAPRPLTGPDATRVFKRLADGLSSAERGKLRLVG
jgi:poly-gamma-glutamate synthesis protein (capsule biosynthesis protein)